MNLSQLVEEWLDDLNALPDSPDVEIQKEVPPDLYVAGAKRYISLIVQNLLENSRKYNRKGGRIRVAARANGSEICLTIGNAGQPIARDAQEHIFDRFRRAATGATVSGHGLGLNLARELARLHDGDLKLVRSADDWTEFELRLSAAQPVVESLRTTGTRPYRQQDRQPFQSAPNALSRCTIWISDLFFRPVAPRPRIRPERSWRSSAA